MEKKTKQRILGALVVISAVILLLPLLQTSKHSQQEPTSIKAPPFPEQVMTSAATPVVEVSAVKQPEDTIQVDRPNTVGNKAEASAPVAKPDLPVPNQLQPEVKEEKESKPLVSSSKDQEQAEVEPSTPTKPTKSSIKAAVKSAKQKAVSFAASRLKHHSATAANDKNGLVKLTGPAWVIQIGNYKNKTQALRLVNQLRANGYGAFMQQLSGSFGNSTQVYVGPKYKQAEAFKLADRLAADMHIRGVVISYKPLGL